MMVTIFTPTYNRSYIINQVNKSLLNQTNKDFEWLIIDDGSNDGTESLINSFIKENSISLRYFKQNNGGKHRAINKGLTLAEGELFFIVDSDDYLTKNAISLISEYHEKLFDDTTLAGVSFRRGYNEKEPIGSKVLFNDFKSNVFDFRYIHKIKGDQAEVYKTEILKNYNFPDYKNEKFCAEGLLWNRLGLKYKILWTSKIVYICNYLEDGLTSKTIKNRKKSPKYSMLYYSELEKYRIPYIQKLKANINFWRFSFESKDSIVNKLKRVDILISLLGFPIGVLMYLKDNLQS
jgi:glycosyltransferase involved in cell wall biosynthesis